MRLLRGLYLSASLYTFLRCIASLARYCLASYKAGVSPNSPNSFLPLLAEGTITHEFFTLPIELWIHSS